MSDQNNNNNNADNSSEIPSYPSKGGDDNSPPVAVFSGIPIASLHGSVEEAEWSTGLFDCLRNKYNAFDTFLCPCCVLSQQVNRVFNNEAGMHWPLCLCVTSLDVCCTGGLAFLSVELILRQKVRQRYHLKQNFSEVVLDMLSGIFCTTCMLCQQHREMTRLDEWPGCVLLGEDPRQDRQDATVIV